jgi:DNA-binding transcriptional MerR regulator
MNVATVQIEGSEFLQTIDVAVELDLTVEAINKAVQRGTLRPARKLGVYRLFDRDEIERYRTEHLGRRGGFRKKSEKLD